MKFFVVFCGTLTNPAAMPGPVCPSYRARQMDTAALSSPVHGRLRRTVVNHCTVYLNYRSCHKVDRISLPHHIEVKILAVYIQGAGVNFVVVIIDRRTRPADSMFFDEFVTVIERDAALSALVMIVGDVNIYLNGPITGDNDKL